ncbi:hypothetical protein [Haloplanus salilacus]
MTEPSLLGGVFRSDDSVWRVAATTGLVYLLALGGLFVLLFLVPYLLC